MDLFDDIKPEQTDAGADFLAQQQNEVNELENQFMNNDGSANLFDTETLQVTEDMGDMNIKADSDIGIDDNGINMDAAQNNPFGDNLTFDAVQNEEPVTSSPIIESINNKYDIKIEAESITEWRKQFQARIDEADEKEAKQIAELEKQAQKDLDDWLKQRKEALEQQRQTNIINEQSFIDEREERSREGNDEIDWIKVSDLCDFNAKNNKKSKDTTRMKTLFLSMKGEAQSVKVGK